MSDPVKPDDWLPTIQFGFMLTDTGNQILHQMWVTPMGLTEWRPVPMINASESRPAAVAGYLSEDDDEDH